MNVTLRPDRSLLDANFESYKLSLEKIPIFKAPILGGVDFCSLKSSLSKQHLKAYSCQNCLFIDPFHLGCVYYITTEGKIFCVTFPDNAMNFNSGFRVCEVPQWRTIPQENQLFAALKFPSVQTAVVYDGVKSVAIFDTGAAEENSWKLLDTLHPPLESHESVLLEASSTSASSGSPTEINFLFGSVVRRPEDLFLMDDSKSSFITYLDWFTYKLEDACEPVLTRHRKFAAASFPDYVAFELEVGALHICSERQYRPIFDSSNTAIADAVKMPPTNSAPIAAECSPLTSVAPIHWTQVDGISDDDTGSITLCFELPTASVPSTGPVPKDCVQITISSSGEEVQTLRVQINLSALVADNPGDETVVLLDQKLYGFVEKDAIWSIDRETRILEVHLNKLHALHWPRLLHNAICDQQLVKPKHPTRIASEVESIQDRQTVPNATGDDPSQNATLKPAYNVEQLEDVDFPMDQDEDDLILQRFDAETLEVTHQASLSGHQWLLNVQSDRSVDGSSDATSALCIRHDVDGIVWLPYRTSDSTSASKSRKRNDGSYLSCPWQHICTLQAFGYVLASKRDHRFVSAPPLSPHVPLPFVAVADTSKRIYVYRQPLESSEFPVADTELRRRKVAETGGSTHKGIVHVAWQHVICLPDSEEIVGFASLLKPYPVCVVCTKTNLYLLSLNG